MISESNLIAKMFDLDKVKKMIEACPIDEVVILCPNWPINKPKYFDALDTDSEQFDLDELEDELNVTISVSDYNDLIADPHGIYLD